MAALRVFAKSVGRSGARYASVNQAALAQASGLPGTYAGATYTAACGKSDAVLNAIESDFKTIKTELTKSAELREFVSNPTLSTEDKKKGIDAMLRGTTNKSDGLTKNLLEVLVENGRLPTIDAIIEQFEAIMSAHRGEVNITVTSAEKLDSSVTKRLESTLKNSSTAKAGKSVNFNYQVNPGILGGLLVDFGDKTIDLSVSGKVKCVFNAQSLRSKSPQYVTQSHQYGVGAIRVKGADVML